MRWIEMATGYACNAACPGCFSASADPALQMSSAQALNWLRQGRVRGARHAWFGGGEPTIRRDFLPLVEAAKKLGYERLKVQTNGFMFAYPELVERAQRAGMNEVNLLLKSRDPATHDALMGRDGAFSLLEKAIANLRNRGLRLEGDVLVTTRNLAELPSLVAHHAALGFAQFNLWLFSASETAGEDLRALVPSFAALAPLLSEARRAARDAGARLVSLHTPHCLVTPAEWDLQFDPAAMGLWVVNPGGHAFLLSESEMERGSWVPACDGCAVKGACRGPRPDYVAVHGSAGLRAFPAAEVEGHDPAGKSLEP